MEESPDSKSRARNLTKIIVHYPAYMWSDAVRNQLKEALTMDFQENTVQANTPASQLILLKQAMGFLPTTSTEQIIRWIGEDMVRVQIANTIRPNLSELSEAELSRLAAQQMNTNPDAGKRRVPTTDLVSTPDNPGVGIVEVPMDAGAEPVQSLEPGPAATTEETPKE